MKKIVIRVDSGKHIGIGHSMRCMTLARSLAQIGHDVLFCYKDHEGRLPESVFQDFKSVVLTGGVKKGQSVLGYRDWLGTTLAEDLRLTNAAISSNGGCDLLIVDHYALDASFESGANAKAVMVIDDLANRSHQCELLLDQNITASSLSYEKLVSRDCVLLLGPDYALLNPEFSKLRSQVDVTGFNRDIKNIVVFFGGADSTGLTLKMANAIQDYLDEYEFDFVLSDKHEDYSKLLALLSNSSHCRLHSLGSEFPKLVAKADLFIGAGGATSWERATLGVASVVVSLADNQFGNCLELSKRGLCYFAGELKQITPAVWQELFSNRISQKIVWSEYRKKSFDMVDANGVERVQGAIDSLLQV